MTGFCTLPNLIFNICNLSTRHFSFETSRKMGVFTTKLSPFRGKAALTKSGANNNSVAWTLNNSAGVPPRLIREDSASGVYLLCPRTPSKTPVHARSGQGVLLLIMPSKEWGGTEEAWCEADGFNLPRNSQDQIKLFKVPQVSEH